MASDLETAIELASAEPTLVDAAKTLRGLMRGQWTLVECYHAMSRLYPATPADRNDSVKESEA